LRAGDSAPKSNKFVGQRCRRQLLGQLIQASFENWTRAGGLEVGLALRTPVPLQLGRMTS
jgi:hypothetical protein